MAAQATVALELTATAALAFDFPTAATVALELTVEPAEAFDLPAAATVADDVIAAAPSDTSEQSVLRSGAAMRGFCAETVLQVSKSSARCRWASGLRAPLAWFFTAMRARAADWSPWRSKYCCAMRAKMPGKLRPSAPSCFT